MQAIQLEHYQDRADKTGCVALRRTVIYQALGDACYQLFESSKFESKSKQGPRYISCQDALVAYQARRFLLADTNSFLVG